jgi:superfamily II DNA or RNA helicase
VNKYLVKVAEGLEKAEKSKQSTKIRPHQEEALRKLDKNKGIILGHSLGGGKTLSMLKAIEKAQKENKKDDALFIAPASLVSNLEAETKKHGIDIDRKRLKAYSFEKATRIADELASKDWSIAAVDEAHKLRNSGTKRARSLNDIISKADKRILATGTSVYNSASDIAPLINMAAGYKALPETKKDFDNKFIRKVNKKQTLTERILRNKPEQEDTLHNKEELADLFKNHVSFYDAKKDPSAKDKFPTSTEKTIEVPMDKEQLKYYKFMENKIPFLLRFKLRHGLPMDKQDQTNFNSFSVGVRQVSNTHRHLVQDKDSIDYSPKIKKAIENLESARSKDKNFKSVVYSNFLEGGVHEYSRALQEKGIPHGIFTGKQTAEEKDRLKKDFNAGKMPVLLISSSGGEGLDLKGVKLVQHLDGFFHNQKAKQISGRAIRYESHEHLPKEERHVNIEHYRSVHPKPMFGVAPMSIDTYLDKLSQDKDKVFSQVNELMEKSN